MRRNIEDLIKQVTDQLQTALSGNLVSVLLYGSHARKDATDKSDVNLFVVVHDGSADRLAPLLKLVPDWIKHGVMPPVIFEQDQIARSLDTFALEFLEISSARRVLFGSDPFADFAPDWNAIRWELEQEAREKTVALQRRWLAAGGKDKIVRAIIADTVPGYLALLRGAVQVQQKKSTPVTTAMIFDGTPPWPGFESDVWQRLWKTAKGLHVPSSSHLPDLMNRYLEQARILIERVDRLVTREEEAT
jgi:hypothetical protein